MTIPKKSMIAREVAFISNLRSKGRSMAANLASAFSGFCSGPNCPDASPDSWPRSGPDRPVAPTAVSSLFCMGHFLLLQNHFDRFSRQSEFSKNNIGVLADQRRWRVFDVKFRKPRGCRDEPMNRP